MRRKSSKMFASLSKKLVALVTVALVTVSIFSLTSCGGGGVLGDGKVKPATTTISGPFEGYLEVVDGIYQFTEGYYQASHNVDNVLTLKVKVLKPFEFTEGKDVELGVDVVVFDVNGMPITEMAKINRFRDGWWELPKELKSALETGKGEVFITMSSNYYGLTGVFSSNKLEESWRGHYRNFINEMATFELKLSLK